MTTETVSYEYDAVGRIVRKTTITEPMEVSTEPLEISPDGVNHLLTDGRCYCGAISHEHQDHLWAAHSIGSVDDDLKRGEVITNIADARAEERGSRGMKLKFITDEPSDTSASRRFEVTDTSDSYGETPRVKLDTGRITLRAESDIESIIDRAVRIAFRQYKQR